MKRVEAAAGKIDPSAIDRVLAANRYLVLGTADENGVPWVTPVFFAPLDPNHVLWVTANQVVLIDRDESQVDIPDLDLVLPHNAAGLDDGAYDMAVQASAAWGAAVYWDNEYAVERLAVIRAV
ncbi:pyridoxamine 5'-phosphate oxidase family protein [Fodinicola feengrottensis]|uniref:Pyridoxamine 5'-phosphate oxidase putative domain-containing protein n=1 Tax=Fodinicola feengrottensis TaxID=435914 RepID=A0ABN2J810_9ACTN|nr:pyridoxamine 5'-phosphate oxidase family protein [Fodinicola feengrottensis]